MKSFKQLFEDYDSSFSDKMTGKYVEVFVNPTLKEMNDLKLNYHQDSLRGYLIPNGGMYVWGATQSLHYTVSGKIKALKSKRNSLIPLYIYFSGKSADVVITDNVEDTKWDHNSDVADAIRKHKHMKKLFSRIDIDVYDSAIEGNWSE